MKAHFFFLRLINKYMNKQINHLKVIIIIINLLLLNEE